MTKTAVIGVFGKGPDFTTGQAVKCYELSDWFSEKYGEGALRLVNTYKWKKNPFKLFFSAVSAFLGCEKVIIMPAPNGIKVFGPLSYFLKLIFRREVHYVVIGGWLGDMLKSHKFLKKCVAAYEGIYVETHEMERKLEAVGIKENVFYMPNFRKLEKEVFTEKDFEGLPLRACTYSRVVKEKGIEDACEIVKAANEKLGKNVFTLDIYGKIDEGYEQEFKELLEKYKGLAAYKGVKKADEGVKTLTDYFALLFPTYYEGEGLAGTVLDAFASGTPVIANDWKYIKENIEDGVNGMIYPFRDVKTAALKLCLIYENKEFYGRLCRASYESAKAYSTDKVLGEFAKKLYGKEN